MIYFTKLDMDINKAVEKRQLSENQTVQIFVDSEVVRLMDPYTPFRDGTLKNSPALQSRFGSGKINQQTPYAKRLYYNSSYKFNEAPRRGAKWFERMKQNHKEEILKGAKLKAGAK